MENLKREILQSARHLMEEKAARSYTDIRFLNIGIGVVVFARDEPQLFRALLYSQPLAEDISSVFSAQARRGMKEDTLLRRLPDAALGRLWGSFWLQTVGLGTAVISGQIMDRSDEIIVRVLKNAANTLIFAEIAGIGDCDSGDNAREWSRLLLEKKIILPGPG
jgi:hypothetical protein